MNPDLISAVAGLLFVAAFVPAVVIMNLKRASLRALSRAVNLLCLSIGFELTSLIANVVDGDWGGIALNAFTTCIAVYLLKTCQDRRDAKGAAVVAEAERIVRDHAA